MAKYRMNINGLGQATLSARLLRASGQPILFRALAPNRSAIKAAALQVATDVVAARGMVSAADATQQVSTGGTS